MNRSRRPSLRLPAVIGRATVVALVALAACKPFTAPPNPRLESSPATGTQVFRVTHELVRDGKARVQAPTNLLVPDEAFAPVARGNVYSIRFAGDAVTLEGPLSKQPIRGRLVRRDGATSEYALDLFAGGRLTVYDDGRESHGELVVYGSGVPIVTAERGTLNHAE